MSGNGGRIGKRLNSGSTFMWQDHLPDASHGVALGDFDADGDLDAILARYDSNTVWINDGSGNFFDSEQLLGNKGSKDIGLGDLNGDGILDAFVANWWEGNGNSVYWGVKTITLPGDINSDGIINLTDAILGLKILSNMSSPLSIPEEVDLDNDGKIGLLKSLNEL